MITEKALKTNKYGYDNNIKIITLIALLAMLQLFTLQDAAAQSQNIIILDKNTTSVSISPHSYVTRDKTHDLNAKLIIERSKSNLYGRKNSGSIINLGVSSHPSWILFSVDNKTNIEDWVLDFGNVLDGRMGMAKKIYLFNDTNKQSIIYPEKQNGGASPFMGSALPIKITAGKKNTFVLYIENGHGMPVTIAPKVIPKEIYVKQIVSGDITTSITAAFFLIAIVFFTLNGFESHNREMLALSAYYILLAVVFFSFNNNFINSGIVNAATIFLSYMANFITLVVATKLFTDDPDKNSLIKNIILIIIAAVITVISIMYIYILEANSYSMLLLTLVTCICVMVIITLVMFKGKNPSEVNLLFCLGMGFILLSSAMIPISVIGNIHTALIINLFWYLQVPAILCFTIYNFKHMEHIKTLERHVNMQKSHERSSISKLQSSKNSADQARLLRIIDQEKELMTELRQREVKRAEEMRHAKELADKANHDKSAFLAVVSHEIRTPMNGVLGMIQLIKDTEMTEKQKGYVDVIHKSSDTMMVLLNDILDFEKIENGSMELEIIAFNLKQMASDLVILMSSYAAQKNIVLKADIADDTPIIVMGDPTRLRQVLLNLINNALKFTDEGQVTIEIRQSEPEHSSLIYFAVKDSGIGIPEETQAKLFTPFKQADASTSRKYGGTGLGLAISSKLIEAMGSKIKVESQEGLGSTFSFEIELEEKDPTEFIESNKQNNIVDSTNKIAKPMDILVVEDNEMNRKVMDGFLSQKGHTLSMAASGQEALEICQKEEFDLILMDIQMDGMSGIEATKSLRDDSNKQIATTPIIAITGNVMLEDVEEYFAVGMNGFIAKPIDANNLNDVIYNASIGKFENAPEPRPNPRHSKKPDHNKVKIVKTKTQEIEAVIDISSKSIDADSANANHTEKEQSVMKKTAYSSDIDDNLDTEMLHGLINTLGKDKFIELLIGFVEKAEDIINNMNKISEEKDIATLGARGHELKGMSGNFGMKKVSAIASEIEKNAKMSNEGQAIEQTKKLNAAIEETKAAFDKLLA